MKKLSQLCIVLFCIFYFQSCTDDDFNSQNSNDPIDESALRDEQFKTENFGNATTGKFIGSVKDASGNRLENVLVTIGNITTMTDYNGFFVLNDVNVFEKFAYVTARKDGYIDGSRTVIPKTTGVNKINITLLEKNTTATINSGEISEVSLANGTSISFGGNFIAADGNPYSGTVDVVVNYVRPNSSDTFTVSPGNFLAQTADNEARALETYGMISVNLFSPSGEELNIDPQTPATITFPVDFGQTAIAPETIKLWYFDEEVGYWKEEGQAVKNGNNYVGEVTHFTWWNVDVPFDPVQLCFTLTPENSPEPVPYFVSIKRVATEQFIFYGLVTSLEAECGLIPINEEISVAVYGGIDAQSCNNTIISEQTFGGFSSDASIDVTFQEEFTITPITGTATDCDGDPITNGYLYVNEVNTFAITNGTIDIGVQTCANITETVSIQLFDSNTNQLTVVNNLVMDGNPIDLGNLSTCDSTGGIYNGDVNLVSQEAVNNFSIAQFSTINGSLIIGNSNANPTTATSTDITDISSLSSIQNVSGRLSVRFNDNLTSLQGLQNISEFSSVWITNNASLTSLDGLENITSLGAIILRNNPSIGDLQPLSNLTELTELHIDNCDSITSLEGLEQITELRYLFIHGNNSLTTLQGLENLVTILPSTLPSIVIGARLEDNGTYVVNPNNSLTDYCALQNLFSNGNGLNVQVYIQNNPFNPTPQDIANGNCSD